MTVIHATEPCEWCGERHLTRCPQIKAVEYYPDGRIKRYEFLCPKDYPALTGQLPGDWRPSNYPIT